MTQQNEIFTVGNNAKIGGNTAILNLPPVLTCTNCATCSKTCYAKFRYQYPNVQKRWNRNWENTKREDFVELATYELRYKQPRTVRFHESGDFYSVDYINKCAELAQRNPQVQFYAYTKNKDAMALNKVPNMNVIYSLIETEIGEVRNYGTEEYCNYLKENYNVFVCPHNDEWKAQGKKCMVDCTHCRDCKGSVCFIEHGRSAKKDTYSDETLLKLKANDSFNKRMKRTMKHIENMIGV